MNAEGQTGLVPANYVEFISPNDLSFRAIALHNYDSIGGEEMSFVEGQILDVIHRYSINVVNCVISEWHKRFTKGQSNCKFRRRL